MCDLRNVSFEMRQKLSHKRVAIIHPVSAPWVARIFDGIHQYAREDGEWHIFFIPQTSYGAERSDMTLRSMKGWRGDGIIMASNEPDELRFGLKWGIPMVNLAAGLKDLHGITRVMVDNYKAGQMAAEHLLERNLTNLAYFGWSELWYSLERHRGFSASAAEAGANCFPYLRRWDDVVNLTWSQRLKAPVKWLATLPLPCGIFASQDARAQLLLEACHEAGLRVPNDIAIVGMDNNETICEHSIPKLTSISRNSANVGYQAAAHLDAMMAGNALPVQEIILPPDGIVARESSDMMYCSDPLVQGAIEYMRQHIRGNYNIEAVAERLGVSKRKLERSFAQGVNSSPHQYLTQLRIQHAQAIMELNPQTTIESVAAGCGFGSATTFYAAFQRITGVSPSAYRKALKTAEK